MVVNSGETLRRKRGEERKKTKESEGKEEETACHIVRCLQ